MTQTGNSTINPYITVTAPNGGESVTKCSSNNNFITWSSGNTSGTYKAEQSLDGGSTWVQIAFFCVG